MEGVITRIISNLYTVQCGKEKLNCQARGKFRNEDISPLVGDEVIIDKDNKYILEIKTRKNELLRPQIANVDNALVITSLKKPDLSLNLLDKQLINIEFNDIEPIIILTKYDLLDSKERNEVKKIVKYYKNIGYIVLLNTKKNSIKKILKNKTSVLTGQTGAGKSSLLNRLNKDLNLETKEISKALGRGVHTTRHVELFEINNGFIADTPGFSALGFDKMTKEDIRDSFREFKRFNCDFKNCMHLNEKECRVIKAVNNNEILKFRYENYKKFIIE